MRKLSCHGFTNFPARIMAAAGLAISVMVLATPSHAELTTVDQMVGLEGPVRVTVSSTGDIFVTGHEQDQVVVFDETGMKIATLPDLAAPLGLAIREVAPPPEEAAPVPEPVPAYCPTLQDEYMVLVSGYEDQVTSNETLANENEALAGKYDTLADQNRVLMQQTYNLVTKYRTLLKQAQASRNKKMIKQYTLLINQYLLKATTYDGLVRKYTVAAAGYRSAATDYRARMAEYQALIDQYVVCESQWNNNGPPTAATEPAPMPVIYVGNEDNGSVQVIDNGSVSSLGSGAGEFGKPNGIAVTSDGQRVYVVDSAVHQVKVYDGAGVLVTSFGGEGAADGQLNFPIDIALNESAGEVYVTDFWNSRVVVYDLSGVWLRNLAPTNDVGDPAFNRPSGLGLDPEGNLYVVDNALSCVVIMNNLGVLIDMIGYDNGQYWTGELALPLDVAADGERVYVTSGQDGIVKVFEEVAP